METKCKTCLGCNRLEDRNFKEVYRCENYMRGAENFSKEYNCRIEVETYEARLLETGEIKTAYRLKVMKLQKVLEVMN